jgi:hypothetical protein
VVVVASIRDPSALGGADLHSPLTPHGRLVLFAWKGGTNLRVCLVTLQGSGKFEITQSKYRLSEEQKQEDGQKLFDFCASCLKTFIETNLEEGTVKEGEKLPLGFTVRPSFRPRSPALIAFLGPLRFFPSQEKLTIWT